jgi:hypothetical protein
MKKLTEVVDEKKVYVECVHEKRIELIVKIKETFEELNERVTKKSDVLPELSFLCFEEKEINNSRTLDEMDVSDGYLIVQKISPLANLLKPDILTPSIVSSLMDYVETVEILKVERILTNSFFGRLSELMNEKIDKYYPIISILTSIVYRHSMSQYDTSKLHKPMNECGIIMILEKQREKVVESEKGDGKEKSEEKVIAILAYSLIIFGNAIETSLLKRITEYLIKMIPFFDPS